MYGTKWLDISKCFPASASQSPLALVFEVRGLDYKRRVFFFFFIICCFGSIEAELGVVNNFVLYIK